MVEPDAIVSTRLLPACSVGRRPYARRRMAHRLAGTYLAQRTLFGMKFGLETMRALVAELGHPERAYPSLLVAGTNGKGSVAAYCDAALRASGLRAGPLHLPPPRARERADHGRRPRDHGRARSSARSSRCGDAAARLVRAPRAHRAPDVLRGADRGRLRPLPPRARVDVAVLEVGLGGRLDATNVVEPLASAIVSLDFDHQAYLGTTLAAIAAEKAGVLRRGRATVLGPLPRRGARGDRDERARDGRRLVEAPRGALVARSGGRPIAGRDVRPAHAAAPLPRPRPAARRAPAGQPAGRRAPARGGERGRARRSTSAPLPRAVARTRWPGRLQWSPAIRRSSSTAPTTRPARAPSPRTSRRSRRSSSSSGRCRTRTCAASPARSSRSRAPSSSPARGSRAPPPRRARARAPGRSRASAHRDPDRRARARSRAAPRARARPGNAVVVAGSLYLVGAVMEILEREKKRKMG